MAMITFTALYILVDSTSNLDDIIDRKVPFGTLMRYYALQVPIIGVQVSAIACLISVLITYSSMNNHNEIIVLRSSGLSFWQIAKPALCFGLLVSFTFFWVNERFVPKQISRLERT